MDRLLRRELDQLAQRGLLRRMRPVDHRDGAHVLVDGREAIDFSSNDYLGLATEPALSAAATRALEQEGSGAAASRLITGNRAPHRALENALARWKRAEAALLFNSGYHANVGVISALVGPEDAVYSDALNHASIIDGCRLSRATVHVFPHRDIDALARELEHGPRYRRRLIATDSIFSMDGDAAPLGELAALARRHDAILMADEAHATGVVGPAGRGLGAELGLDLDVTVGTLGKALGSFGAYVAGSATLVEYLVNRARSFVFTTALPPAVCAATAAALELCAGPDGDARRARLRQNAERFAAGLRAMGIRAAASHIIPVVIGDPARTMQLSDALLERGIFVQGIRPPTVPPGTARLRFAMSAAHTDDDLDRALAALRELR